MNKWVFPYAASFTEIIDEEFFLINSYPEVKDFPQVQEIATVWRERHNLRDFNHFLEAAFERFNPVFITTDEDGDDDNLDIVTLRMQAISMVLLDYERLYRRNFKTQGELFVKNELGLDSLVDRTLIHLAKDYLKSFLEMYKPMTIPDPFVAFASQSYKHIRQLANERDREAFLTGFYELQENLTNFVDDLDDFGVDLESEQIFAANILLKWITYLETLVYYLLLVRERLTAQQTSQLNIPYNLKKPLLEEREERLDMTKIMTSK